MVEFTGISVEDFAHPAEKAALAALRKVKFVEKFFDWIASEETRLMLRIEVLGNYFGIAEKDYPSIYILVREVCRVLDYDEIPKLYMYRSTDFDIKIFEGKEPLLVFPDFIVYDYDEDMLRFEIGRAITVLKAQTNQLKMAVMAVGNISSAIPVLGEAIVPVLANWSRKATFTEDRGGLLACQDVNVAFKALMRVAGLPTKYIDTTRVHEYIKTYTHSGTLSDMSQCAQTIVRMKPWNNDRIVELYKWHHSGQYDDILEEYE